MSLFNPIPSKDPPPPVPVFTEALKILALDLYIAGGNYFSISQDIKKQTGIRIGRSVLQSFHRECLSIGAFMDQEMYKPSAEQPANQLALRDLLVASFPDEPVSVLEKLGLMRVADCDKDASGVSVGTWAIYKARTATE